MEPEVLVLDEPAAGLDPAGRRSLIEMINNYREKTGSTVVIVSHSMEDIARMADRLIVMNKGEVAMDGTLNEVFSQSDRLAEIGLDVPEITKIFAEIKKRGIDVPLDVYSLDRAEEVIRSMLRERGAAQ